MKEIERIIEDVQEGHLCQVDAVAAIEQYVIKARIEELENIPYRTDNVVERIAQLKKKITY